MKFIENKFISSILIFAIVLFTSGILPSVTSAAGGLLNAKDVMSSQATSATADHTLTWTLASGHTNAAGGMVTIQFVSTDFVASGTWAAADFSFSDNVRTNQAPVGVGTVSSPATCTAGANNYTVDTTAASSLFRITFCSTWTTSSTGTNTFKILGTSPNGLLTNKSTNVESSIVTITNSVNDTDSTSLAVVVETNDVVTVSANVNPTLTLAISASTVTLSPSTITTAAPSTGSNTAQIATNSAGGFLLTYNGTTLTSSQGTIAAYGSQASSVAGTAGFGINMKLNTTPAIGAEVVNNASAAGGTCTAPATDYGVANKYSYTASTTTSLTNQTAPGDCTFTISYVANISSITPAGSYTAPITYIASGTF